MTGMDADGTIHRRPAARRHELMRVAGEVGPGAGRYLANQAQHEAATGAADQRRQPKTAGVPGGGWHVALGTALVGAGDHVQGAHRRDRAEHAASPLGALTTAR